MFDNIPDTTVQFPKKIEITENRAPTDESIKLLSEFQDKAIENLLAQVHVSDNVINGHIMVLGHSISHLDCEVHFKFTLNNVNYQEKIIIARSDLNKVVTKVYKWETIEVQNNLIKLLVDRVAQKIAQALCENNPDFLRKFVNPANINGTNFGIIQ